MLIFFYNFLLFVLYLPFVITIYLRKFLKKEHKEKYKEKIFLNDLQKPKGFLFWFHAASIGELKSVYPLIDFLLKENKNRNILVTTVTLTSFNEFEKKYGASNRVFHQFLPYDINFLTNNFLKKWNPDFVTLVDSEIWPNFIFKVKRLNLPLILINARITKKTFRRWKIFNKTSKKIFESFSSCICANRDTYNYLNILGAKNIKFFGNIKFCSSIESDIKNLNQFDKVKTKKIWCALSTHADEEILCGKVHLQIQKSINNILTIIVPRHIHRIKEIYSNLKDLGLKVQIKNEKEEISSSADIVLVNYYGSVNKYLKKINQVFIGKSTIKKFENSGGQNPIDAIKNGCHVYHGKYVYNFNDIYQYLMQAGFSEQVNNFEDFADKLKVNFNKDIPIDKDKIHKINSYSEKIFRQVISEYNRYIQ